MNCFSVGSKSAGPTPMTQPEDVGALGEKKKLCTTSPMPVSPWAITGRMVREIRFQSSEMEMGITGWMFRVHLSSPDP